MIRFFSPQWLWLLAFLPLIALWRGSRGDVAAVESFDTHLVRAVSRATQSGSGAWLTGLTLLGLAFLILGMARPQLGSASAPIRASGVDIMLLLDVSGSMRSLDFQLDGKPASRVDVVKSVIAKFIQARPNDRIGLSIFAGVPDLVSPLTLNHAWLLHNLERVQVGSAEEGTAIGSAIAAGVNHLRDQSANSRVIVLLTDSQNKAGEVAPLTAARQARALGIRVYTIGIGVHGDAPYPVIDAVGNHRIVMQKVDLDERTLQQIATTTGTRFYRATNTEALHRICADIDRQEKTTHTLKSYEHWRELYGWFLIPGLLVLSLSIDLQQSLWRRLPI